MTAATGSAYSAENMRLNMLRERVLHSAELGAALLDAIYNDYYSFSPAIADELRADDQLRDQVLRVAVRPLLAWYGLIESLALDSSEPAALKPTVQRVRMPCRAGAASTASAALCFEMIRGGRAVPPDAGEPYAYLASRLVEAVGLPFTAWAIFDPLVRMWTCAATGGDIVRHAQDWLGDAPLDRLQLPLDAARRDRELGLLASGPYRSPELRRTVGARLALAWPELRDELRLHGFVSD